MLYFFENFYFFFELYLLYTPTFIIEPKKTASEQLDLRSETARCINIITLKFLKCKKNFIFPRGNN